MKIAEIYRSVQGEGLLTGVPSVFVRTSGCNLRCWFCDTPYTSWEPEGSDMSTDEIVAQVEEWDCRHVVVTGGEPMLWAELIPLCERLRSEKGVRNLLPERPDQPPVGARCFAQKVPDPFFAPARHVTIETAGTLYLPVACDLMSISPKFASSAPSADESPHWSRRHERERHRPEVVRQLIAEHTYQLKFVVDTPADLAELSDYLAEFPEVSRDRVLLMPQGTDRHELAARTEWLRPYCMAHGLVFCPRKQIEWFGPVRGT